MNHSTLHQIAAQERTRREILQRGELIPPLPDLVVRLLAVLNKQETEPQDLESLMQNDQVLVAKMLAMVNSPFYGVSRPVTTIREAVMVLGFRGVRSLVLATSTAKFLQRDYSCYGHDRKGLWLHAASVAVGAKALGRALGSTQEETERLFVSGLLHDIGKLVLAPYLMEAQQAIGPGDSILDVERRVIGIDHTEAGALVTAKWNLAKEVQEVVKTHHDPAESAAAGDSYSAAAVVRLADAIAHHLGIGYAAGSAPPAEVRTTDLEALQLDDARWAQLRDDVAAQVEEGVSALSSLSA